MDADGNDEISKEDFFLIRPKPQNLIQRDQYH
jgi:hypothetical protein